MKIGTKYTAWWTSLQTVASWKERSQRGYQILIFWKKSVEDTRYFYYEKREHEKGTQILINENIDICQMDPYWNAETLCQTTSAQVTLTKAKLKRLLLLFEHIHLPDNSPSKYPLLLRSLELKLWLNLSFLAWGMAHWTAPVTQKKKTHLSK